MIFGEREGAFSDACNKAIEFGKPVLMRDDWKRIFEPQEIADEHPAHHLTAAGKLAGRLIHLLHWEDYA